MRALTLFFLGLLASCGDPAVIVCLDTLEAKCQKLLDCDPEGFFGAFGDQADVAQCVSQVEQDASTDDDPETQICEEQVIERKEKKTLQTCLELLPDASCEDFLGNRIEECK